MHIEVKQEVWWMQSLMIAWVVNLIKQKNDMHASTTLQKLSCLKFRGLHLFDQFLKKGLIKCIIDEAGGVVGATPEGMGHHTL